MNSSSYSWEAKHSKCLTSPDQLWNHSSEPLWHAGCLTDTCLLLPFAALSNAWRFRHVSPTPCLDILEHLLKVLLPPPQLSRFLSLFFLSEPLFSDFRSLERAVKCSLKKSHKKPIYCKLRFLASVPSSVPFFTVLATSL